jgi:hypothetical protein
MSKRAGYKEVIEYIALNDEPSLTVPEEMIGFPSVQTCAIAFGKTYEQVAEAVCVFRKKVLDV